jgi:hypothetical protein
MAKKFADIAFTDAVKKCQEKHGSRKSYEHTERLSHVNGLPLKEVTFIKARVRFYRFDGL